MKVDGFYIRKQTRMQDDYAFAKSRVNSLLDKIEKLRRELAHAVNVKDMISKHLERISRFAGSSKKNTEKQVRTCHGNGGSNDQC